MSRFHSPWQNTLCTITETQFSTALSATDRVLNIQGIKSNIQAQLRLHILGLHFPRIPWYSLVKMSLELQGVTGRFLPENRASFLGKKNPDRGPESWMSKNQENHENDSNGPSNASSRMPVSPGGAKTAKKKNLNS